MKRMKLLLVALIGLFSFGFVATANAAETTTEEPQEVIETEWVEDEIIVVSEDGEYNFSENWELARGEVQEIYYEDWDKVNLDTLSIYFDGEMVMDNGQLVESLVIEPAFLKYDTEQYENYPELFNFSYLYDENEDEEVESIFQVVVEKDGTGYFYKADVLSKMYVSTELKMTFEKEVVVDPDAESGLVVQAGEIFDTTWEQITVWVAGAGGIGAIGLVVLAYLRERKILTKIINEIAEQKESADKNTQSNKELKALVNEFKARNITMEKALISMITISNIDPKLKKDLIESIKDETKQLDALIEMTIERNKEESITSEKLKEEIETRTKSLLSKLTEKDEA